ncbi:MAG: membrane-bound lytic murein transglycosylase A [Planctomycetota bacterium]|jgi:membrane-bound lytic murein transglycosylase A
MRSMLAVALLSLGSCLIPHTHKPDYEQPLEFGVPALLPLGADDVRPHLGSAWLNRTDVLPALERSLAWTRRASAEQFFPQAGITHERALASLQRLTELLRNSSNSSSFNASMMEEFEIYKSAGWNGRGGGVLFTGYCTPILDGSMVRSSAYRYPLYALPQDLEKAVDGTILGRRTARGLEPYPTRQVIEASGLLENRSLELVWLRDPLDAFIAHVNGSAFIRLDSGEELRLGYAGKNGQPYTSLGGELIRDGEIDASNMNLMALRAWASQHPERVDAYLERNDSYVFFAPLNGMPRGSLNVEVSAQRSLATDKSLFPRGAAVFVDTLLPVAGGGLMPFQQLMFDQDTGGAIRTAGRADIYLGVGAGAERMAGATRAEGQLYYLFLRQDR